MGYKVQAHAFQGYWEDIGTIEAFYNANLALAKPGKTDFRFVCVYACGCGGGGGWARLGRGAAGGALEGRRPPPACRGGAEGAPHARETLGAPVGAPEWRVQEP
jgi:hypothetical protein